MRPPICSDGGRPTNPRKPGKRSSCGRNLLRDLLRRRGRASRAASAGLQAAVVRAAAAAADRRRRSAADAGHGTNRRTGFLMTMSATCCTHFAMS